MVTFYLISKCVISTEENLLNLDGLKINCSIEFINTPFKTKMGKVKLKIE